MLALIVFTVFFLFYFGLALLLVSAIVRGVLAVHRE